MRLSINRTAPELRRLNGGAGSSTRSTALGVVRKLSCVAVVASALIPPATIDAQAGSQPSRDTAAVATRPTPGTPRQGAPRSRSERDTTEKPAPKASNGDTIQSPAEIVGRVIGLKGYPDTGIVISLTARAASGDTMWSIATVTTPSATGGHGAEFKFQYPSAPKTRPAHLDLYVARQKINGTDTIWVLPVTHGKWVQAQHVVLGPSALDSVARGSIRLDVVLHLDPAPPVYTFLLFLPALVGLVAATAALAVVTWRDGQGKTDRTTRNAKTSLLGYTIAGTITWVIVIAWFASGFVTSDLRKISLFDPGVSIPTILPVAAFIGVLVYATECLVMVIQGHRMDGHTIVEPVDYQLKLIELGNRVFIAPYVAIIAVLALFRGATDGLAVPFVAFFTGLWIEPVLRVLKLVGEKLLPSGGSKDKPEAEPERAREAPGRGDGATSSTADADTNGAGSVTMKRGATAP